MMAVVHVLLGAALAAVLESTPLILVLAFFSHYILDRLPHIDPETFTARDRPYTWTQLLSILSDSAVTLMLTSLFFLTQERGIILILGGMFSLLPDILIPLERYQFMSPFTQLHHLFHWNRVYAKHWTWYLVGLATPLGVAAISTLVLWNYI